MAAVAVLSLMPCDPPENAPTKLVRSDEYPHASETMLDDPVLAQYGNWRVRGKTGEGHTDRLAAMRGGPDGEHVLLVMCHTGREPFVLPNGNTMPADPPRWSALDIIFPDGTPTIIGKKFEGGNQHALAKIWFDGKDHGWFKGFAMTFFPGRITWYGNEEADYDALYRKLLLPLADAEKARFLVRAKPDDILVDFDLNGVRETLRDLAERCNLR